MWLGTIAAHPGIREKTLGKQAKTDEQLPEHEAHFERRTILSTERLTSSTATTCAAHAHHTTRATSARGGEGEQDLAGGPWQGEGGHLGGTGDGHNIKTVRYPVLARIIAETDPYSYLFLLDYT